MVKLRPYVVAVNHVEGCQRKRCGPGCKRITNGWEVDVAVRQPDGTQLRQRVKAPVSGKAAALRWARDREAHLIKTGGANKAEAKKPTLGEFWPRFIEGYVLAEQQKPSTVEWKKRFYRKHIEPALAQRRLDEIDDEQVSRLKGRMTGRAPKTVNNTLAILGKALKVAVSWKVIAGLPCTIRLLKTAKPVVEFYEPEEYERLVAAARQCDERTRIIVLLGGDAGLRLGEILGVEWPDLDFVRGLLKVQRAVWEGEVTLPKGGKPRVIPMTTRLKAALQEHRHLRGDRVLYTDEGEPAAKAWVKWLVDVAERRGGLRRGGRVHILRHTFCSRLAMRNVPMLTIKELAGHVSLETTQRYMHLAASAPREAIKALELGDGLETARAEKTEPRDGG